MALAFHKGSTMFRCLHVTIAPMRLSSQIRSVGILAGGAASSKDKDAGKNQVKAFELEQQIKLNELSSILAKRNNIGFKAVFDVTLKKRLEQRPHLVRLLGPGRDKQKGTCYVHSVQQRNLTTKTMQEIELAYLQVFTVQMLQDEARKFGLKPGKLRKAELIELIETHHREVISADEEENGMDTATDTEDEQDSDAEVLSSDSFVESKNFQRDGPEFTKNQQIYRDALYHSAVPIVLVDGPAGTGKTTIACEWAANALKNGHVRRLVITRPSVSAGEDLGYLPGTLEGKLKPYLLPIYDSLADEGISKKQLSQMMKDGEIEVAPISFLRGRTFLHSVIVADEMQNATKEQMKMLLTRLGKGSRMVVTGDLQQSDLGRGVTSGLDDIVQRIERQPDQDHLKLIHLEKQDVKRHAAVATVLSLYDDPARNAISFTSVVQETSSSNIAISNDDSKSWRRVDGGSVDRSEEITEEGNIHKQNNIGGNDGDVEKETGTQDPPALND